jgi:type I restriction enzyme, S subunit
MMRYGLKDTQIAQIQAVFVRYPAIDQVVLYGSRAMGTHKPHSDIDLTLHGDNLDTAILNRISNELDDLLLPVTFDLSLFHHLENQEFIKHIERVGVVFWEKSVNEDFNTYLFSDIIEKFIDYRGKTPNKTAFGIPLITAKLVKDGRLLVANEFIAEAEYEEWMTRGYPKLNDVVLTTEAPLGEVALIKDEKVALAQRIITLQTKKSVCDSVYLKYHLQSPVGQNLLTSRASGSTVEGIKASTLKQIVITLPPLTQQRAIASILTCLDDKIDLLHRQNATLEQMAEVLFRQWFVEEAKEDWEVVRLGDYVKTNENSITSSYKNKVIRYLDTGSLNSGLIGELQLIPLSEAPSRARRLVKHNDILISTVRPDQKHFGLIKNPTQNLVVSTGFCVITCTSLPTHFVYYFLTNEEMTAYLHSIAEGSTSTYPSLKPSDIEALEFPLPTKERLNKFEAFASNCWSKISTNQTQIRTLTAQRDTLLPKLMSGEVRVRM